ncbi:MAG: TonB-dependent receptor [Acidobacteria bacterium]|nr:TonB-dependent receptor [Acidobacteriota bacterium]MCW5970902.1 TonB-dependent receptor [Blastocatellales bacterium]
MYRSMYRGAQLPAALVILSLIAASVAGQNIKSSVSGRVVDAAGAAVAGAAVSVVDQKRGLVRTVAAGAQGEFHFPGLDPGTYLIRVAQSGFADYESGRIEASLGGHARLDIILQPARLDETVRVVADSATSLRTDDVKLARSFSAEEMNDLPTPAGAQGRNFYTQARTAPGVALSTRAHQPFSVSGQRAINNNYLIDSVDNNDPNTGTIAGRGANEQLVSQEAIAGFEVLTHNFKAEYGRNSGGIVSIVTKSGSNDFHGSVYEYHNNSALSARNALDRVKPSNRTNLAGFTLGGPAIKNRAWIFGQFETYRVRGLQSSLFQVPTEEQRLAAAPAVKPLIELYPLPIGGATTFNFGLARNTNLNTWLIRGDALLTENQRLMVRFNNAKAVSDYQGGFAGVIEGGNDVLRTTMSASIQHTWSAAPNLLNEARFGFNRTESLDTPSENLLFLGNPAINGEVGQLRVNGLTSIGVQPFVNKYEFLNNYQFNDDVTWSLGAHAVKFGSSVRRVQVNDGNLDNAYRGQLVFNNINDFISGRPASYLRRTGNPRIGLRRTEWHSYVQDDWRITPGLTLNLGLRYELNTALNEAKGRIPSEYLLATDRNNFAPRFGFAWQVRPKTVLRGGYGIYYNALETVFLGLTRYNPPLIQTFTASSPQFPDLLGNATAAIPSGLVIPNPDAATPYAQHINLTVERELWNSQSTVSAAYVGTLGRKESRLRLPNGGENAAGFVRPDRTLGVVSVLETSANSSYHSLQMNWSQRITADLQVRAAYTFSKYLDDVSGLTSTNAGLDRTLIPLDERNLRLDRGRSEFDIPHILTLTGIWRAPFFAGNRWIGGWSLSSVASVQSGRTFTLYSGTNNLNASNNNRLLDIPGSLVRCGSCAAPVQLSGGATRAQLTPAAGVLGTLGRNTERGDGLVDVGFSLSKDFRVTENLRVQLRGELFNAFNVANFNAVDTVLASPNFGRYTSAFEPRRAQIAARLIF